MSRKKESEEERESLFFDILELFPDANMPTMILGYLYLKEKAMVHNIAWFLGRPRQTAYFFLQRLEKKGLVVHENREWKLSEKGKQFIEYLKKAKELYEEGEEEPIVETYHIVETKEGEEALK